MRSGGGSGGRERWWQRRQEGWWQWREKGGVGRHRTYMHGPDRIRLRESTRPATSPRNERGDPASGPTGLSAVRAEADPARAHLLAVESDVGLPHDVIVEIELLGLGGGGGGDGGGGGGDGSDGTQ